MYALKRIAAFVIDTILLQFLSYFISMGVFFLLPDSDSVELISLFNSYLGYGAVIILYGVLEGQFGWTPGKLILFLRVRREGSSKNIGIAQGILRQILKLLSLSFIFLGAIWALVGIIRNEQTFYDGFLRIDVEDLRPSGLTETQKNWRKHMRS